MGKNVYLYIYVNILHIYISYKYEYIYINIDRFFEKSLFVYMFEKKGLASTSQRPQYIFFGL